MLDTRQLLHDRAIWAEAAPHLWRHLYGHLRIHRSRCVDSGCKLESREHCIDCVRLSVHFLLRKYLGSGGLGGYWRNLSASNSREGSSSIYGEQLVLELYNWRDNPLHGRP